ncbi:MAG: MaoC family dehydratase [Leptospiraceae bacterium]|nr:MaoC family dehydratase [Leptospiraceae bacterium]
MQKIKFNDYNEDQEIPSLTVGPVKHMDLVRYAGASGDFNPIHTDPEFAKNVGLPGTIAHGMYVMAILGRMCSNWAHPAQIKNYNVKFKGMTMPGDKIVCSGKIKKKKEEDGQKLLIVSLQAANDAGEVKVAGELTVQCE